MSTAIQLTEESWPVGMPPLPDLSGIPVDDGEPMESGYHRKQMNLLCELFDLVVPRDTSYVAGNMGLYYSSLQIRRNDFKAPDVFVVFDAVGNHERKIWVVWEEDGRTPNLVVELLSESTERNDRGPKMRIYEKILKVPNYFIYDPRDFRFEGWRLTGDRYVRVEPDARGHLPWTEVNVTLGRWKGVIHGQESTWLRVFDAEGRLVPTDAEAVRAETRRAEAEAQRAEAEAQRAEAAEARVRELMAELARRGAG